MQKTHIMILLGLLLVGGSLAPTVAAPSPSAEIQAEGEYSAWLSMFQNVLNGTAAANPATAVDSAVQIADDALLRIQAKHQEIRKQHGL